MFDMTLFRNPTFAGANTVALLVSLAMFGVFFFISLYMQNVLGYSAVRAGAAFLPMTILIILVAPVAGRASDRLGSRWLMTAGMTLAQRLRCSSSPSCRPTRRTSRSCPGCCSAASAWRSR